MSFAETIVYMIYLIWLFAPFLALGAWFAISLVQFLKTPKEETEKRAKKRTMLII